MEETCALEGGLGFNVRELPSGQVLAVSPSGDHLFTDAHELTAIGQGGASLPLDRQAIVRSRYFITDRSTPSGTRRLFLSRQAARRETVDVGPSLHIIVPTLQCEHSCRYCQVSRSLDATDHVMPEDVLDKACDTIFESSSQALTVEFQGGDPLLRFDLIQRAIERVKARNRDEKRRVRFVVASTLHQLSEQMCSYFADHRVFLSTSVDGPAPLHNSNRPHPGRDAHARTVAGIAMARRHLGADGVSALMTTTRKSLEQAEAIVDEYVRLGLRDIFLRPLSTYGFAKRNQLLFSYSLAEFLEFYKRAFNRILEWNCRGVEIREVYASILLNKMLSPFDGGYVDLQSPTGAGRAVLVYNYDGYVYPSDEARMLVETGDASLRLGQIGTPLLELRGSDVCQRLDESSRVDEVEDCKRCTYNRFCAPNPVDAQAQHGTMFVNPAFTEHCQRHQALFDYLFDRLHRADSRELDLFHRWAQPFEESAACDA